MNYVVDKVKGGIKRGCAHFDTPPFSYAWHEYCLINESPDRVLILNSYLWRWYFYSKVQVLSLLYGTLITFMFLPIDVFFYRYEIS